MPTDPNPNPDPNHDSMFVRFEQLESLLERGYRGRSWDLIDDALRLARLIRKDVIK